MKRLVGEALGTFWLLLAGTGAIVINDSHGGSVTHVGIALTFGLVVLSLIYALGDVSGCHINPAVTLAFWAAGRFPWKDVLPYITAQCVGACAASLVLRGLFPEHLTLGATLPASEVWRSWVMEFLLTCFLMFVILGVATGSKEKGILAGVAIGSVIALEALFAGPMCGASMNPARSLAPALVAWRLEHLWVYLTAPVAGALAGVLIGNYLYQPDSTQENPT